MDATAINETNEETLLRARHGQEARIFLDTSAYQNLVELQISAVREQILSLHPMSASFQMQKSRFDTLMEIKRNLKGMVEDGDLAALEFEIGIKQPTNGRML